MAGKYDVTKQQNYYLTMSLASLMVKQAKKIMKTLTATEEKLRNW